VLIALEHHVSIEFLGIRSDPTDDHTPEVRANDIETSVNQHRRAGDRRHSER
jgi:hypothetical protein